MLGVWRLSLLVVLALVAFGCGGGRSQAHSRSTSPSQELDGSYHSTALDGTIHYSVYLPPGYAESRKRYPVIYFLHGLPANETAYQDIGFITRPVEQSGMPAIVVGAQGARTGDTDPEWHDWGPGRNWETATAKELPAVIDSRYRTIASRSARGIIGISGGGYGATLIAIHNPSVYSVIESWSGYFHATDPTGTAPMDMGSADENDWASAHELVPQLKTIFAGYPYPKTSFGFYVGTDDTTFLDENRQFDQELTAAGIKHLYAEYRGGHTEDFWRRHERKWVTGALERLDKPR
jgi:S-formylglutathione hydrolase FrmB